MSDCAPVPIPRWQWRTFAEDLSWLFRPLSAREGGAFRHREETHLICDHRSHHAWIADGVLELAWRKELSPEGFELWDCVLRDRWPLRPASRVRLLAAWGVADPAAAPDAGQAGDPLADLLAGIASVRPLRVLSRSRSLAFQGVACSLETLVIEATTRVQSFAIEHEDPALLRQVLAELGLEGAANTSFLQGLRGALGLQLTDPGSRPWARKSNASTS